MISLFRIYDITYYYYNLLSVNRFYDIKIKLDAITKSVRLSGM